jgi:hypothetical protein
LTPRWQNDQNDRTSVEKAFADLTSRTDLPKRVQGALQGILDICTEHISGWLGTVLDDLERELFALAERSTNNEAQQTYFDSSRDLKLRRADLIQRFLAAIEDCIVRFDKHETTTASEQAQPSSTRAELRIMTSSDLEELLALQEMTSKSVAREVDELLALGQRFGVLAGTPELDFESLPVGPAMLARALRHATQCLDIPVEHRVLLYRTFDRKATIAAGSFYQSLNVYFRDQRILENIRLQTAEEKFAAALRANAGSVEKESATQPDQNSSPSPDSKSAEARTPAAPTQSREALLDTLAAIDAADTVARRSWGLGGWSSPAHAPGASAYTQDPEPFSAIRAILQHRRHAQGVGPAGRANGRAASADDMQKVLRTMHGTFSEPAPAGTLRRSRDIKRELLAQLRQAMPDGGPSRLTDEDSDAIDLMSMLFDTISANPRSGRRTKALLAKLHMPLLRVPLSDKTFFSSRTHPARQLLDAIAEIGMDWLDDPSGESDSASTEKLDQLTDRVAREFDGDFGLIEEVLRELTAHLRTLVRKAEASERRHVTSAQGREKLLAARTLAAEEIVRCLARSEASPAMRTLLEQSWADVIALSVLRNGIDSAAYQNVVSVAERLAGISGDEVTLDSPLRKDLAQGLNQIGFHQDEIDKVLARVLATPDISNAEAPRVDLSELLKGRARFGDAGTNFAKDESGRRSAWASTAPASAAPVEGDADVRQYWASDVSARDIEPDSVEIDSDEVPSGDRTKVSDPARSTVGPDDDVDSRAEAVETSQLALPLEGATTDMNRGSKRGALSAEELNTLALLRTIPFGTWFEFRIERGKRVRRRLSWYSPMTGRCLFVNQRGAQADECTMEQLASDLVCKRVVVVKGESESIVDRAYRAIVDSLKSITGFGAEVESVPV